MDDPTRLAGTVDDLAGVVTALEAQVRALLVAVVRSGTHPDLVLRALAGEPEPDMPPASREAHEHVMDAFRGRLDEAAAEALLPPRRPEEDTGAG